MMISIERNRKIGAALKWDTISPRKVKSMRENVLEIYYNDNHLNKLNDKINFLQR